MLALLKLKFKSYISPDLLTFFFLLAVKGIILSPELWHISWWQVHCYRLWWQEGHGVWSDLLDWEVTDWSSSGLWRRKGGHTTSHSSDSPSQTDRNSPCLSVWLSVSCSLTFNWLTTDVEEWTLGWHGLGHKCAALQTPYTLLSSYGTREHSMFPSLLFFCFCFLLQIFLCWILGLFFPSLYSEKVP